MYNGGVRGGLQGLEQRWQARQKPRIEGGALLMGTWVPRSFLIRHTAHPHLLKISFLISTLKNQFCYSHLPQMMKFLLFAAHIIFTVILLFIFIQNSLLVFTGCQEALSLK